MSNEPTKEPDERIGEERRPEDGITDLPPGEDEQGSVVGGLGQLQNVSPLSSPVHHTSTGESS